MPGSLLLLLKYRQHMLHWQRFGEWHHTAPESPTRLVPSTHSSPLPQTHTACYSMSTSHRH